MAIVMLPHIILAGPPIEGVPDVPWVVTLRCSDRDRRVWWHPGSGRVRPKAGG